MKRYAVVFLTLALLLTGGCGVLLFALPQQSFSENENRCLETLSAPTAASIWDGSWQTKFEAFTSDQFPARDALTALSARLRLLAGYRDIGGAYVGQNGRLFEKITDDSLSRERFRANLQTLNAFAAAHPALPCTLLLAPSAGVVLPEDLPPLATLYDADALYREAGELLSGIRPVDVRPALSGEEREGYYYRTDHHWTTEGAAAACAVLCREADWPFETPQLTRVTDRFYGSLYSKVLYAAGADTVSAASVPDGLTVTADGKPGAVYDTGALDAKDCYRYFFGGNWGKLVIRNEAAASDRVLLVVKDSFANCLVPMLTGTFREIVMLDLRYFSDSTAAVVTGEGVTDVLFLFELSHFAADPTLVKLRLE